MNPAIAQPASLPKKVNVSGLRCQSCVVRVERALQNLAGVERAEVHYASESALVWGEASLDAIIATIQRAGYTAHEARAEQSALSYALPWHLWLLLLLWSPFALGMVGMALGSHALMLPEGWQMMVAWLVQSAFGLPFYRGAWAALKAKTANMDTLVALGTTITLLYSTWAYFGIDAVYFEASVMVITLVALGKYWEQQTKRHSLNALSALLKLQPKQVCLLQEQSALWVDLSAVKVGDVLRVRAGERIGADGIVLAGAGRVDESHLTGESAWLSKTRTDGVLAGSLLIEGTLDYRVNKIGAQTLLGDMVHALDMAQNSRAPMARLTDKVAAWFVPAVVGLSLLTFVFTDGQSAWVNMAAVLVVACPCALGLAVPASLMAGLGLAVKHGVWFKDGATLEATASIDTVVLDKTGTLTEGRAQVVQYWQNPQSALSRAQLLQYMASLEIHAHHPLAGALLAYAQCEQLLPVQQLQTQAGAGIRGMIDGHEIGLGSADFVQSALPDGVDFVGQSVVLMTVDKALCAVFGLQDAPKADALWAREQWRKMGIAVMILSGDRHSAVQAIAQSLGIDEAVGECSPRDKAEHVQALVGAGRRVMMVGDGVNDVAALAEASVGAAFYAGAAVASETAGIRLMKHDVQTVVAALWVARQTLKNIKQNLALAFLYNAVMLPLAALGYLSPALAGTAMALSSLAVLGNALRLKRVPFKGLIGYNMNLW